jgi:hypothetical protein
VKLYGLKVFFAAALALTLALKSLLYYREFLERRETAPADHRPLSEAVAAFLLQHGFKTHLEERFGQFLVHANAGKCRILISEADPQRSGTIELLARPVGPLSYLFDGAVHEHEPSAAWALIDKYLARVSIKMGVDPSRHTPVLAVAASDECSINALPWWELSISS